MEPSPVLVTENHLIQSKFPKWIWILVVVLLAGWILAGFFGYSKKKVEDEFKSFKATHSEGVTIYGWKEIAGKAYPVTMFKTVLDTSDSEDHKHKETTWRSGVDLGAAMSPLSGNKMIWGDPDLFPVGPITTKAFASFVFPNANLPGGDLYLGGGIRIQF